jgi:hypothetical protein
MKDRFGPPLPTLVEAKEAGRSGWNLRCNLCGGYGAAWHPGMRPNWGALALCHPHGQELSRVMRRYADELAALTKINFEQDR